MSLGSITISVILLLATDIVNWKDSAPIIEKPKIDGCMVSEGHVDCGFYLPTISPASYDSIVARRLEQRGKMVERNWTKKNIEDSTLVNDMSAFYSTAGVEWLPKWPKVGGTCCVSCGSYQICGRAVTSSCGSCTTDGGSENKDIPPVP